MPYETRQQRRPRFTQTKPHQPFDTSVPKPTQQCSDSRPFRFLELPSEICNHIYAYVAREVHHIGIRSRGENPLTNSSVSLGLVSKQIRTELLGVCKEQNVCATAMFVSAEVVDFNFRKVLQMLKGISSSDLTTFDNQNRFLRIRLVLTTFKSTMATLILGRHS